MNKNVSVVMTVFAIMLHGIAPVSAAEIVNETTLQSIATIEDVVVNDGVVSGRVVNRGKHRLEDVQLVVNYDWLWQQEFQPGTNSPSWVEFHTLPETLSPGASAPFTIMPTRPLPIRNDGETVISARVMGFTEYR
jgi:hypothetical protein